MPCGMTVCGRKLLGRVLPKWKTRWDHQKVSLRYDKENSLAFVRTEMNYFQHDFDCVEKYLHHRKPYLLIDHVVSVESQSVVTSASIVGDEFFIEGHFPGAPILPGAMMQEMSTQTAGVLIAARYNPMAEFNTEDPFFNEFALGVLVKVKNARFRGFARPGDELTITATLEEKVGEVFDFRGQIEVAGKKIMQNKFQLTNIPSKTLQG
jgi:3-hydroxyacyl-[acyl-carrier-protein] dehydratase